ncbi:Zinc finger protein 37A [Armadillidium nasatum]|uniref:Zinc finger protein 37A n=1 Tax=Armadillidium nasatum TaxID=96803 RepID=A0A5N5TFR2_9CRUS|nr:Zinc finger protein 37A [Armadillidium nasatum]
MKSSPLKTQVIVFSDENEMKNVHLKGSIDPQYRCNICNKKYTSLSVLKIHKIRHKEKSEQPFECIHCTYKSATKRDLQRHHERHLGHARQVYKCDYCDKSFKIKEYLLEHSRSVHTKEIMFKCGQCSFTCFKRSIFRNHLKSHNVKIKVICPICNAMFKRDADLKTHLRSHAEAKPFSCEQCDKSFIVKNRLIRHIQAIHTPKAFECDTCEKAKNLSNVASVLMIQLRKETLLSIILIKQGLIDDPCEGLSKEELQSMIDRGKKTVESHLQVLQEKGLTKFSYQDLEKVESVKKKIKEDFVKIKLGKKTGSKKRKSQTVKNQLEFEQKKGLPTKRLSKGNIKDARSLHNRINLPYSDLALLQMDDILPEENDITVDDSLNNSNTPTIHVLWNLNYPQSEDSKTLSAHAKQKSNGKRNINQKVKSANINKRKALRPKNDSTRNEKCRSESNLNASHLLEDSELTFNDKSFMQLHESENFSPGNCNNDLQAPLANLTTDLVTFEEMDSPNTIVVTPDINSYIDKVYKNVELCNQFLHVNEEEPHLICTFETVSSPQGENRITELKVDCNSTNVLIDKHKIGSNSTEQNHTNLSDEELGNFHEDEYSDNSNSEISNEIKELIEAANCMTRNKEVETSVIDNEEASNLMITIHSLSNFDTIETEMDNSNIETEEIILLQENEHGGTLSPLFLVNEVSSVEPSKEIVIKNSSLNMKLDNDDMMVTSIAEVEENESEVVLVIS